MGQKTYPGERVFDKNVRYVKTNQYRNPLKGEYFLSGAIVTAYKALNDLSSPYWIAKPIYVTETDCPCCHGLGKVTKVKGD